MDSFPLPPVGSRWFRSDGSNDIDVVVEEVKKRGRGYYVVTSIGRFRLKDFRKLDLIHVEEIL